MRRLLVLADAGAQQSQALRGGAGPADDCLTQAPTVGGLPSTQLMLFSLKMLIMLMSTKSTPSFCPATPFSFIAGNTALVNLVTCWTDAGPAAPLIHAKE